MRFPVYLLFYYARTRGSRHSFSLLISSGSLVGGFVGPFCRKPIRERLLRAFMYTNIIRKAGHLQVIIPISFDSYYLLQVFSEHMMRAFDGAIGLWSLHCCGVSCDLKLFSRLLSSDYLKSEFLHRLTML